MNNKLAGYLLLFAFVVGHGFLIYAWFARRVGFPAEAPEGRPKLVVGQPVHDFGDVEQGKLVQHGFVVKNEGSSPLHIKRIVPCCGGMSAHTTADVIEPGQEARLHVNLSLRRQQGRQNREVLVETNDPQQPRLRLSLVGNSFSRVQVEPQRLELARDAEQETMTGVVEVRARDGLSFDVVETRTSADDVVAQVAVLEPGTQYRVGVSVQRSPSDGPFHGWVHLVTDQKGEYEIIGIPVVAPFLAP
jgi:hypothetical protein